MRNMFQVAVLFVLAAVCLASCSNPPGGPGGNMSPLLGKKAGNVRLPALGGGEFDLANHVGKNVVMLDFWATWCGPCVKELPLLVEVADEYASKGVVFCAINQGETPDTIKRFLSSQRLKVNVALDQSGAVGNQFGVQGIPFLMLIDTTGTIQAVHIGYKSDIQSSLRYELDAILEGRNLAQETRSAHAQPKQSQTR